METCPCEFNGLRRLRECQRAGLAFFPAESFKMNHLEECIEGCTPFEDSWGISNSP